MKNLSVKALRKIIIEEIKKMIIQDDALFSRGDLTNTGTGAIMGLDVVDDDDDWYVDYDNEPRTSCSTCGEPSPCQQHDVDWKNPEYGHFKGNINDLTPDEAFGTGYSMGQSGDFE